MPAKKTLSLLLALVLLLLLVIWMISGDLLSSQTEAPEREVPEEASAFRVETRWLEAEPFAPSLTLQGQLHPWQTLEINAETSGRVNQLLVEEGEYLQKGQVLLALDEDTRPAQLARLQAEVATRQAEVTAAERLRTANHLAKTEYLRLKASLLQVQAELEAMQLDIRHTRPRAPFAGYLEEKHVELGSSVQPGQTLARVVNIKQLKAEARVPQQSIHQLQLGQPVTLELLDGRQLQGQISFIAQQAESATRSFRIQAKVDNPEQQRLAGASTSLRIHLPATTAHYLSASLLSLDEAGRLGVKQVDENNRVVFTPIQLLSSDTRGAWVSGLPVRAQVITLGGGFVHAGDQVEPVVTDASGEG
ncbi:membrane fusion protein, multidrug efflux system [Marinospirillum celere]|uniref:Membrane fusion protein, multidrug efflux system n=1 Tax=Marinospirillum celere TaxID=1122252 RepID=A0A1I1H8Q0_9GAMM|nr:efflux RND transporter periplasmic adaptor subunit [Marinospirillum celere]SFC20529.1 membrane fusion protein, multidrug efflux system [Marinospirillum celere]